MNMEVRIVSQSAMQSGLLAQYLNASICLPCTCHKYSDPIDHLRAKNGSGTLFVLDYAGQPARQWLKGLIRMRRAWPGLLHVVLINAGHVAGTVDFALGEEVDGIIYEDEPPEMIVRGVKAVLSGELWFPRKVLSQYLSTLRSLSCAPEKCLERSLTKREQEILALVSRGVSNVDIARKLNIRVSTVKTHLYRTYEKIDVPNRTTAALWASRNL
jgi:LuxR family transcriptional regulator of csgAB operon